MNRTSLITMIAAVSLTAAILEYATSAQLAIPVLFAFPLALCAGQRSRRLLWLTATIAVLETLLAGFWAFHRTPINHWVGAVNRGLVLDSLLGLTILFHVWIGRSRLSVLEAARTERHRISLIERNEQLEQALAKIKTPARGKRQLPMLSLKQYQALAAQLSDAQRTFVIAAMCSGQPISEVIAWQWHQLDAVAASMNPVLSAALEKWRTNGSGTGPVFPSLDPARVQKEHLAPKARKLGLPALSWAIFPRSYTAWIAQDGLAAVHQKLLRPAQTLKIKGPLSEKTSPGPVAAPALQIEVS
jgi:hypothetical protein